MAGLAEDGVVLRLAGGGKTLNQPQGPENPALSFFVFPALQPTDLLRISCFPSVVSFVFKFWICFANPTPPSTDSQGLTPRPSRLLAHFPPTALHSVFTPLLLIEFLAVAVM